MACSDKQREANRRNAQKSTGPRTPEGKIRASQNSTKDGFSGKGKVVHKADKAPLRKKLADFNEDLLPINSVEGSLVGRMALSDTRHDRCVRKELAEIARRKRRALKRWDKRQMKRVDELARALADDPSRACGELHSFSHGCD